MTGERTTASENGVVTAAVVGSILGGLIGGLALYSLTTFHLPFMASIVGLSSPAGIFGAWMGAALVMGLLFGSIADPAIDYFASLSTWLTERFATLRILGDTVPAGNATAVGFFFGLVMGDVVGLIAVPAVVGGNIPPLEAGSIVIGYAVFGLFLGFGYEHTRAGTIPIPSASIFSPGIRAAIFAPLLAGAVSGAIVYSADPLYLRYLSTLGGYGSPRVGFGFWMVASVLLGLAFAGLAYNQAARGNSTTGYGFVYGVVLAVFVGLLAIPAIVSATTAFNLGLNNVGGATLAAFVVYGLILGSVYGKTLNRRPLRPTFLAGRTRATVIAALLAGGVTGAIVYTAAPIALVLLGFLPGPGGAIVGFVTWVGIAVLLGCGFAAFPARRVERDDFPGHTGLKLGLAYGILVALPVGGLLVPRAVETVIFGFSVGPLTQGKVLGAWVLVGLIHGVTYGAIKGDNRATPLFLQGRSIPLLGGVVAAGAVGAGVAYVTSVVPGVYLQILGSAVGATSLAGSLAVWFGIALLSSVLFIPFAAQSVETKPGLVRGLVVGAVFGVALTAIVGAYLVPTATGIETPHTNPPIISYFVFGLLFGGVYGVLRKQTLQDEAAPTTTAIGSRGQRAILFGSLFGGAVGGLVIYHMVAPVGMLYFSSLIGYGSYAVGWIVWLVSCVLFGSLFAVAIGPRITDYADSMGEVTENDEDLEEVFGDIFETAPLTTTAAIAGLVYGIVLAVAVGAIGFPIAINAITPFGLPVPTLQPYFLFAFVVYGLVMGAGYGVVKEF